jgi:hypothetical protein
MKAAVRKEFEEGVTWMEETLAASRRIAWLSLAPGRGLDGGGPRYLSVRETDSKVIPEIPATEGTTPLFFFRYRLRITAFQAALKIADWFGDEPKLRPSG